jgi:hypothetical protein
MVQWSDFVDPPQPTAQPAQPAQQVAQSSPIQMRPIGNGQVQVIDMRTGQVLYTGSASGASNAQASQSARVRRILD